MYDFFLAFINQKIILGSVTSLVNQNVSFTQGDPRLATRLRDPESQLNSKVHLVVSMFEGTIV